MSIRGNIYMYKFDVYRRYIKNVEKKKKKNFLKKKKKK